MVSANTVEIDGALKVVKNDNGTLSVTLLKTPEAAWASTSGGILSGDAGLTVPTKSRSFSTDRTQTSFRRAGINLPSTRDDIERDPHYYSNGNNGLSVAESTSRVVNRLIYHTWEPFNTDDIGDPDDVAKIVRRLIKDNKGRDYCYTLGGRAKNMKRDLSLKRYTLVELLQFAALLDGALAAPII
jgi:hypothetical protein